MITGGNVTVYVSDMDRAVAFLRRSTRADARPAVREPLGRSSGWRNPGHRPSPKSDKAPAQARGCYVDWVTVDQPIDQVVQQLSAKGVQFRGPVVQDQQAGLSFAFLGDQDGNDLYLCEVSNPGRAVSFDPSPIPMGEAR